MALGKFHFAPFSIVLSLTFFEAILFSVGNPNGEPATYRFRFFVCLTGKFISVLANASVGQNLVVWNHESNAILSFN